MAAFLLIFVLFCWNHSLVTESCEFGLCGLKLLFLFPLQSWPWAMCLQFMMCRMRMPLQVIPHLPFWDPKSVKTESAGKTWPDPAGAMCPLCISQWIWTSLFHSQSVYYVGFWDLWQYLCTLFLKISKILKAEPCLTSKVFH